MSWIERIYATIGRRKWLAPSLLVLLTALLLVPALSLSFNENIMDFLPLDRRTAADMDVYSRLSGADRIIVLADGVDRESSAAAVDSFKADMASVMPDVAVMTTVDVEAYQGMMDDIYRLAPVLMRDSDFVRAKNILNNPDSISQRLQDLRERMLLPGMVVSARDPLGIYAPVLKRALRLAPQTGMDIEDGYIFLPDSATAMAIVSSPYGPQETDRNGRLMHVIDSVGNGLSARVTAIGTIPVSVTNASRIKQDSIISIAIAVVLISLLLIATFARKRNLLLIPVAIAFGLVFALGIIGLIRDEISLIVIGISAIIIGIAVNYPLHFITHADDGHSPQQVLKDISKPLIIGNITTVGSFLCLVPLKSRALQDLGLFAALLLVGSILFVIIFLPHFVTYSSKDKSRPRGRALADNMSSRSNLYGKGIIAVILLLTVVLGWFSSRTSFDTDLRNISYMTEDQRNTFSRLSELTDSDSPQFMAMAHAATLDSALAVQENIPQVQGVVYHNITDVLPSMATIRKRTDRWNRMAAVEGSAAAARFSVIADSLGFSPDAFRDFTDAISHGVEVPGTEEFAAIRELLATQSLVADSSGVTAITRMDVPEDKQEELRNAFNALSVSLFNINDVNAGIATSMTDEFNYIAFACGFIVFFFLWISFGRLELAVIAFIPMALSWVWILGLMAVFGLQFNIVNIILATFIFGQGDDYTIFITEGVVYEHRTGRKMPASFKTGILISALIMFFGIGALAFAVHPALQSLAWVTILGMGVVVFMAYFIPPVLYGLIIRYKRVKTDNKQISN